MLPECPQPMSVVCVTKAWHTSLHCLARWAYVRVFWGTSSPLFLIDLKIPGPVLVTIAADSFVWRRLGQRTLKVSVGHADGQIDRCSCKNSGKSFYTACCSSSLSPLLPCSLSLSLFRPVSLSAIWSAVLTQGHLLSRVKKGIYSLSSDTLHCSLSAFVHVWVCECVWMCALACYWVGV